MNSTRSILEHTGIYRKMNDDLSPKRANLHTPVSIAGLARMAHWGDCVFGASLRAPSYYNLIS